jgi:hypothetical protein
LKDILHCLSVTGKLVVALPNLLHYNSRWQLVKGNFNYQSAGIWDNTHFKWYTYKTGAVLLEMNGFEIIHKTVTGQLPAASIFSKIFSVKVSAKLYKQLKKLSPGLLGYQLLYVAQAKRN